MTNTHIATILRELARKRAESRELKTELVKLAVEEFGWDQEKAKNANLEQFFDGYLVGKGMVQSFRKAPETAGEPS